MERGSSCLTHRVDLVNAFPALVALAAHPVSVEVGADAVQHFAGEAVVLPLLRVELEHTLVHQVFPVLRVEISGTGGISFTMQGSTSSLTNSSI